MNFGAFFRRLGGIFGGNTAKPAAKAAATPAARQPGKPDRQAVKAARKISRANRRGR